MFDMHLQQQPGETSASVDGMMGSSWLLRSEPVEVGTPCGRRCDNNRSVASTPQMEIRIGDML